MGSKLLFFFFIFISSQYIFAQDNKTTDSLHKEIVFEKVEVEASFPGGHSEWVKFLVQNLKADIPIDNGAPIGIYTVMAQFIVGEFGLISDLKVLTNFGYGMEEEVLRVLRNSPPWLQALQDGEHVKAYRKQPITFVVEQDGLEVITKDRYILYTGTDNAITINADKVKSADLFVTITQGEITSTGNGNYIVRVNNPGKAIIEVYNKKKKNLLLGSVYFQINPQTGEDNKVFEKAQIEASFPGGEKAWRNFLEKNLKANVPLNNNAPSGSYMVIIQFIVHKDGSLSDLKTLTNHGYGLEVEALRVMKKSPNWIPAMQNGNNVTAYRKQPLTFVVMNH